MENTSATALQSLSRDLADAVKQVGAAVDAIDARRHLSSSGVYWRDGIIVTAAHTLRRTEDISVILAGGQTVAAALARADPSTDLAVIKVDAARLTPPRLRDSSQLEVGHVGLAARRRAARGLDA